MGWISAAGWSQKARGCGLTITNTRYQAWHGASFVNPDEALGAELATWLNQGVAALGRRRPPHRTPPLPSEAPATSGPHAPPEGLDDHGRAAIEERLFTDTASPAK